MKALTVNILKKFRDQRALVAFDTSSYPPPRREMWRRKLDPILGDCFFQTDGKLVAVASDDDNDVDGDGGGDDDEGDDDYDTRNYKLIQIDPRTNQSSTVASLEGTLRLRPM